MLRKMDEMNIYVGNLSFRTNNSELEQLFGEYGAVDSAAVTETALAGFLETILPHLDERRRRLLVGATAVMLGRGGRTKVAELSGVSRPTVAKAPTRSRRGAEVFGRQRSPGGGRQTGGGDSARFVRGFEWTWGSPVSSLRWIAKRVVPGVGVSALSRCRTMTRDSVPLMSLTAPIWAAVR